MGKKKKNRTRLKDLTDLEDNEGLYFNRELSWIKFNERILSEAANPANPLLERINFFSIAAGNFDEFFQVRVPEYQKNSKLDKDEYPELWSVASPLEIIYRRVIVLMRKAATLWRKELEPALEEKGIHIVSWADCNQKEREGLLKLVEEEEFTILRGDRFTDLGIDEHIEGFALLVETRKGRGAIPIQDTINRIGRFVPVPNKKSTFIPAEEILQKAVGRLFDEDVYAIMPVRLTREAEKILKGDDADDIIAEIQRERKLSERMPSRLEIPEDIPFGYTAHLVSALDLAPELVYDVRGLLGYADLKDLPVSRPELRFHPFTAKIPEGLADKTNIFRMITDRDRILFTPYQSFDGLVNFLEAAGEDPYVSEICMTLYRLGSESPVAEALISAAKNGKKVTAVVELKASFDEERNFLWSQKLADAGVHVLHGVPGLKTHAKCCLVTRREGYRERYYASVSTGNYNAKTARIYSDLMLFTDDPRICEDLKRLFDDLSKEKIPKNYPTLIVSPEDMETKIFNLIEREMDIHTHGGRGHIILKMNSLTEKSIINSLYAASKIGVKIELCVRGICMLRPGIPNVSENISVVSVVGRFLEHARVFYFANNGNPEIYIGSPDMMSRNLHKRIEVLCPVFDKDCRLFLERLLAVWLSDSVKGYRLDSVGRYTLPEKKGISSQEQFISMMKQ